MQQFFLERCDNGEWKSHWWLKEPGNPPASGSSQDAANRPSSRSVWSTTTAVAFSEGHNQCIRHFMQVTPAVSLWCRPYNTGPHVIDLLQTNASRLIILKPLTPTCYFHVGAKGPKVNLQLLTNVPPAEEASTEWGWGAPLPSNAKEVGQAAVPHVDLQPSSSQFPRRCFGARRSTSSHLATLGILLWQGRWHGGGPGGAAGPLKSAVQKNVRLCRGHSAVRWVIAS